MERVVCPVCLCGGREHGVGVLAEEGLLCRRRGGHADAEMAAEPGAW
mgnify:CR=1 FL=1